jgi:hypothetical protein
MMWVLAIFSEMKYVYMRPDLQLAAGSRMTDVHVQRY